MAPLLFQVSETQKLRAPHLPRRVPLGGAGSSGPKAGGTRQTQGGLWQTFPCDFLARHPGSLWLILLATGKDTHTRMLAVSLPLCDGRLFHPGCQARRQAVPKEAVVLGPLGSNPQASVTDQELHQLLLQPPVVLDDALESRERREGCRWAGRQPSPTRLGRCSPQGIWESKIPGRQTRPRAAPGQGRQRQRPSPWAAG